MATAESWISGMVDVFVATGTTPFRQIMEIFCKSCSKGGIKQWNSGLAFNPTAAMEHR